MIQPKQRSFFQKKIECVNNGEKHLIDFYSRSEVYKYVWTKKNRNNVFVNGSVDNILIMSRMRDESKMYNTYIPVCILIKLQRCVVLGMKAMMLISHPWYATLHVYTSLGTYHLSNFSQRYMCRDRRLFKIFPKQLWCMPHNSVS